MKQIKKQLVWILCVAACLFSLTACGSGAQEDSDIDPMMAASLEQQSGSILSDIVAMPADQIDMVIEQNQEYGSAGLAAGLESYKGLMDDLGAYVSSGTATVKTTDDGYEISIPAQFEKRECEFVIDVDKQLANITGMAFNPVYSLGENMVKAALNTLMGMGTVFVVLIFISLLISCFKYISVFENKMKAKSAPQAAPAPAPVPIPVPAAEEDLTDDLELVAVITAAVAAAAEAAGTVPADGLVVRSIRRVPGGKWKKA